eukprot:Nitzschia sp. Nitz4//scaffold72_size95085//11097//12527//NITZ4_004744-RA/size95085-processed-gene-0.78-mRNA-1//1//CDS//3329557327//1317//frame0
MEPVSSPDDSTDDEISFGVFDNNGTLPDDPVSSADLLIAKELANLSMKEREEIYFDIHGVSDGVDESEDQIQKSLKEMDDEMINSSLDKSAFLQALQQDSTYVWDPSFRLRFLRAERFDAKAAAKRFLLFFSVKRELFGDKLLTKEITQDDLDSDDLEVLYSNVLCCLPVKNTGGRILVVYKMQNADYPLMSIVRRGFYALMSLTDDEDTQKKGCVVISYLIGQGFSFEEISKRRAFNQKHGEILSVIPLRVETMHLCLDSFLWRPFLAVFKLAMGMFLRLRSREHYGDHQQVMFSLQTHGIPVEFVEAAVVSMEANATFWHRRREHERRVISNRTNGIANTVVVGIPSRMDVLLGRGKLVYDHFGNVRLRMLIEQYAEQYDAANVQEKTKLANEIVQHIQDKTGRFLRDDGVGWVEVDNIIARKKVAHAFRTLRGLKVHSSTKEEGSRRKKRDRSGDKGTSTSTPVVPVPPSGCS